MRRLSGFILIFMFLCGSWATAWENPLVNVSSPTSQAVKNAESSSRLSLKKKRKKKIKKKKAIEVEESVSVPVEDSSSFSATVGTDHTSGFNKDIDPVTTFNLGLNYNFNSIYRIGMAQSFSKLYSVMEGEREVKVEDMSFNAGARLFASPLLSIYQSFSATAPLSDYSKQYGIISRVGSYTSFSLAVVEKVVTFSLTPGFQYTFNRFTTSPTSPDGGGFPLQQSNMGISSSLSVQILDKWDANLSASYRRIFYEKIAYENEISDLGLTNPPEHAYSFSFGTSYTLFDSLNASISVAQADRVEKEGGVEIVVFDAVSTIWSAGLTYSF